MIHIKEVGDKINEPQADAAPAPQTSNALTTLIASQPFQLTDKRNEENGIIRIPSFTELNHVEQIGAAAQCAGFSNQPPFASQCIAKPQRGNGLKDTNTVTDEQFG